MTFLSSHVSADIKQVAYAGRWMSVVLLTWGMLLTAGLYYRERQKPIISEARLTFQMRSMTETEHALYLQYFADLKTSDLRAKSVRFGLTGAVEVNVDVTLNGKDDPRLKEVVEGLGAVRDEAIKRLEVSLKSLGTEIELLEAFLQQTTAHAAEPQLVSLANERIKSLRARQAVYQERITNPQLPVLGSVSGSNVSENFAAQIIGCFIAAFFTALAGGFVFGYIRLLTRRVHAG
jgi:hypothetical protein